MTSNQNFFIWIFVSMSIALPCLHYAQTLPNVTAYQSPKQASITKDTTPSLNRTQVSESTCLANKNFGKNLSLADIAAINNNYNKPSPFTFGSMIGVNDGGLVFRSFQGVMNNQMTQLTTQFRNFHTMDEDFDNSLSYYAQNVKPKDTYPEGTPANMVFTKTLYNIYKNKHGFTNITAATELLQYSPQSWKEKIYLENDWSASGPAGIRASFENYTKKFIDEMAPPNGASNQLLVSSFQVGNELWDYPVKSDYHDLVIGARNAFVSKYGPKSAGGWKMKLAIGAFQAFRENTCTSNLRNFSNCSGSLERHDFIGDYLDIENCDVLKDIDAIDCHPYSFIPGTLTWTHPENPISEAQQIRNLAGWRDANKNTATGALTNTNLWSSEFGYDSHPVTGVGEKTQSAYLIRGLMMHSRYHFEKVFFYNAYDVARPTDTYYSSLYNSSGFWKLGTHSLNSAWSSPFISHGATAKPSWYGMLDLKTRFGNHVFYKALVEDGDVYAYLLANADGTNPCIVFWSPKATNDANINNNITVSKVLDWAAVLPGNYKIATGNGQVFTANTASGELFAAATGNLCGTATLTAVRRNPAFIHLVSCAVGCSNINDVGIVVAPSPSSGNSPFSPGAIANETYASGGTDGYIVYQWQKSTNNIDFIDIPEATYPNYTPPSITQTTYYRRGAKRSSCNNYLYTPSIALNITVINTACPLTFTFKRKPNQNQGCNATDCFYEVEVSNVTTNEQILIEGLPTNGINIGMSSLNNISFNTTSFNTNVQYINANTYRWPIKVSNGSTQKLKLYFCWANYPAQVASTTATYMCSGLKIPCVNSNIVDPGGDERSREDMPVAQESFQFLIHPNPGSSGFMMTYSGASSQQAIVSVYNTTGQLMTHQRFSTVEDQQQWPIDTQNWPQGVYFVHLQTSSGTKHQIWKKY